MNDNTLAVAGLSGSTKLLESPEKSVKKRG